MPIWAAQKNRLEFGFINRIGSVVSPTADQPNVLDPLDALTHPEFCRSHILSIPYSGPMTFSRQTTSRPY